MSQGSNRARGTGEKNVIYEVNIWYKLTSETVNSNSIESPNIEIKDILKS